MKKITALIMIVIFFLYSPFIYGERIYISRLSDTEYFMDQYHTGTYSESNCGPTSLGMVFNYMGYPYQGVAQLRNMIRPYSGWVYTDEIEKYLLDNDIPYTIEHIQSEEDLIRMLCNGGMVMVCLNVAYIAYDTSNLIGRSYQGGTGHYLVISGYYKDDTECYFEVLDPSNKQVRYYKSNELIQATISWCPWAFIFYKTNFEEE